ncbi:MAG TPA: SRPBCC family protein [Sporichthyaceae bacterium]|jgi:uncharacterized protein YndB with AHSA1/START domain|nr:SRPBCC family protein [Sporichthyaceae bacterium]
MTMGRAGQVQVETAINAEPTAVYELVADLPRMGEWSPECREIRWKGGANSTAVGARFRGHNRNGLHRWITRGVIVAAEPGQQLAWEVSFLGLPMSRWSYEFTATDRGCLVAERWEDRQIALTRPWIVGWLVTGVRRRPGRNEQTMRQTLQQLKSAVEPTRRQGTGRRT